MDATGMSCAKPGQLLYGAKEVTVLIRPEQFALSPLASSSAAPASGVTARPVCPAEAADPPGPADAENA
jgi:hypothetical protein